MHECAKHRLDWTEGVATSNLLIGKIWGDFYKDLGNELVLSLRAYPPVVWSDSEGGLDDILLRPALPKVN